MRTVIILSFLFGVALCVPVVHKDQQPTAALTDPVQAESALDQTEVVRKPRHVSIGLGLGGIGFGVPVYGGYGGYGGGYPYGGYGYGGGFPGGYGYGGGYPYGGYGYGGGFPGGYGYGGWF